MAPQRSPVQEDEGMKVGFIGLGGMGKPIAVNIVKAGFEVTVNDLRETPVRQLVQYGARAASSAREVAAASDIVLASLASNQASEEVALGPDGALAGAKSGDIYIDTSTISPRVIRAIATQAAERGVEVLAAPVSGNMARREEGSLAVMVGGEAATLARAMPVLETFGGRIFHAGPIEALVLGVKAGLSVETLREVIPASTGASRAFDQMVKDVMTHSAVPPAGSMPHSGIHTMVKDTALASELARELSVPLLVGSVATQAYLACEARGLANHEVWAIAEIVEELAGIRVRPEGLSYDGGPS